MTSRASRRLRRRRAAFLLSVAVVGLAASSAWAAPLALRAHRWRTLVAFAERSSSDLDPVLWVNGPPAEEPAAPAAWRAIRALYPDETVAELPEYGRFAARTINGEGGAPRLVLVLPGGVAASTEEGGRLLLLDEGGAILARRTMRRLSGPITRVEPVRPPGRADVLLRIQRETFGCRSSGVESTILTVVDDDLVSVRCESYGVGPRVGHCVFDDGACAVVDPLTLLAALEGESWRARLAALAELTDWHETERARAAQVEARNGAAILAAVRRLADGDDRWTAEAAALVIERCEEDR